MTFKPMLGMSIDTLEKLKWPLICSMKLDGIRAVTTPDGPRTRSLKTIPNSHVAAVLASLPPWLDGELVLVDASGAVNFRDTTSAVMSRSGTPNFTFMVFDYCSEPSLGFADRLIKMRAMPWFEDLSSHPHVTILSQKALANPSEAEQMFQDARLLGHEGLILRAPEGRYKHGRSTLREQGLLKMKPWMDAEGTVIDCIEEMFNANEAQISETGHTKRSSHQEGKIPKGTMGALVVKAAGWDSSFEIGTGFTAIDRRTMWAEKPIGKTVKFSYIAAGGYDKPRHAVFLGFRAAEDMGE